MIDSLSFLLLILVSFGLSQIAAVRSRIARTFWSCAPGVLLLFAVEPYALAIAVACLLLSLLLFMIGQRTNDAKFRARLPYLLLILVFVPDALNAIQAHPVLWLGSAFFIVRQMMTVSAALKTGRSLTDTSPALILATFFFAAIPSGPVFNGLDTWDELAKQRRGELKEGFFRLLEGFASLFAFAGFAMFLLGIVEVRAEAVAASGQLFQFGYLKLIFEPLLAFGFLFFTFYGYSRMAEGMALLFGFEVPENFNKPHLAKDLGDFWKRWHRSMANFVMQYIYLPLLVSTGRPKLAIIAAFGFMGIWHNFSLNFLIWGVGHGVALGYCIPWARRNLPALTLRMISLAYVVMLSSIAHGVWF